MILTGRMMDAAEAERSGLVSRVGSAADLLRTAMETARKIARLSANAVMLTKEMVNEAYDRPLSHGVKLERCLFHSLFAFETRRKVWPPSSISGWRSFARRRTPKPLPLSGAISRDSLSDRHLETMEMKTILIASCALIAMVAAGEAFAISDTAKGAAAGAVGGAVVAGPVGAVVGGVGGAVVGHHYRHHHYHHRHH